QDVARIRQGQEPGVHEADADRDDDEDHDQAGLAEGGGPAQQRDRRARTARDDQLAGHRPAPVIVAADITASGVASARSNSPLSRPSAITSTRSLMPSTSGSSDEISRI